MLELIIKDINTKIEALRIFDTIHSLCHVVQTKKADRNTGLISDTIMSFPACYLSDGEFNDVAFDNKKSVMYSRRNGAVSITENDDYEVGCKFGIVRTIPIRIVGLVFNCFDDDEFRDEKMVENIVHAIVQSDNREICQKMSVDSIRLSSTNYNVNRYDVINDEFNNIDITIPFESIVFSIDLDVIIESEKDCFVNFKTLC